MKIDKKKLALSLIIPLIILVMRPMGMDWRQTAILSCLILVITWWSGNVMGKIPASLFLMGTFLVFGGVSAKTVFSFPLSESFLLIAITYLFSRGISNSGIVERLVLPILKKFANTPVKAMLAIIFTLIISIYIIPQPIARLIIIAMLFDTYLKKTSAPIETQKVLMFVCFLLYAAVNMASKNADIILNVISSDLSGTAISDFKWMQYMAIPAAMTGSIIFLTLIVVFRKELLGIRLNLIEPLPVEAPLDRKEKWTLVLISCTILLWVTYPLHGINQTLVTVVASLLMALIGILKPKDIHSIDMTTLIFLSAAFSIGGVMKASGTAEILFTKVGAVFPQTFSLFYVAVMIAVAMLMHMVLGSNTTTLSVVIPGYLIIAGPYLPSEIIMFITYASVAVHALIPFHSVALMIGVSNEYFSSNHVLKFGIPMTAIVFLSVLFIYMPWWRMAGFL